MNQIRFDSLWSVGKSMAKITRTQSIALFLNAKTHQDLAALYNLNMECQVNVGSDGGQPTDGEYLGRPWRGWTDGITTWKMFRIPYNASTSPTYEDKLLSWDLADHAEGIGMTGWDWHNRVSKWVAFDFDAITGHSDKHTKKLTNDELKKIETIVSEIPWVTIRRSTSGSGLHVYVFIDDFPTQTHTEHAALGRALLGKLAAKTGYNLQSKVDVCGGNMWVWHRKMIGTNGLTLIKQGDVLSKDEVPVNWRDHVQVIAGKSRKVKRFNIETDDNNQENDLFNELIGKSKRAVLDDTHRRLLQFLEENNLYWEWDNDHGILITHTWYLQRAKDELNFRGIFKTNAQGTEARTDYNCFAFPISNGAWIVRRYSQGIQEHESWHQDGQGWTRAYLNREADINTAARSSEGVENTSGGFVFRHALLAVEAAKILGAHVEIPNSAGGKMAEIKEHKDGRLVISVKHEPTDNGGDYLGWVLQKDKWVKIVNVKTPQANDSDLEDFDEQIRHLVTATGTNYGWSINAGSNWRDEPLEHAKLSLNSLGHDQNQTKIILGTCVMRPWVLVNMPFEDEYPGDRRWNKDAVQLRFQKKDSTENLKYPHWTKILKHIGASLDSAIKVNAWCRVNGIKSGEDYLRCWIASLLKEPTQPLPYLFFWSLEQNTGKSIFHEALSKLFTKGVQRADTALASNGNFNGELEGSILCIVEETDLKGNKKAYEKIKDWVTSIDLLIHPKTRTPFTVPNTTHWVQCANSHENCPIFPGDSRITMVRVSPLDPLELIPKKQLLQKIEEEASDFITAMLAMELPPSNDRLNVPIIETEDKKVVQRINQSLLNEFIALNCVAHDGSLTMFSDFYDALIGWLPSDEMHKWSKPKVSKELPLHFPKGSMPSKANQVGIGNMALFSEDQVRAELPKNDFRWVLSNGLLYSQKLDKPS